MALTPMMQQYLQVKDKCKDCILFFRLGDFYEMFFEDAEVASRELELVLTGRDCGLENRAPMCGIPYHAANAYISRLVNKGYKIAICEQMEDPSSAKGIVKRDIIKIITPGTYTDSSFLEENKNNYIMSVFVDEVKTHMGICFADISTGDFYCTESTFDLNIILDEIARYYPKEILLQDSMENVITPSVRERFDCVYTFKNSDFFVADAIKNLCTQFNGLDCTLYSSNLIYSANGLLSYILDTQKQNLCNINLWEYYSINEYLAIDINSRRNLELTENMRDKSKKGSLLWVIDKTCTSMGSRMLRKWLEQPLLQKEAIDRRLSAVEELTQNQSQQEDLKNALRSIYDMERIVGKIATKSVNAKEMLSLKNSLSKLPEVKAILSVFTSQLLKEIFSELDDFKDIFNLLEKSIIENPGLSIKDGNIIKSGFSQEIDELRNAKAHGKEWIAALESSEKETTGIKSLKIGYNKVFGYYIEITNANKELIPEGRYIRKQTLSNAERYITPELKEMEDKILGAEEKLINLEYDLFVSIREQVEMHTNRMKKASKLISELDCLSSLATAALENNYIKPSITIDGKIIIEQGRHPVVEKVIASGAFVANDTKLDSKDNLLMLITGPNMAGKSTYMRQVALITLLAQIGSFVPAEKASISICDRIFTRIGASDDLSAGKSTFMVEMWEVSNILRNATSKSLVILDEVGRGTSTYDGLSIAWSVIEHICCTQNLKCKTLFATHYHELTKLEGVVKGVRNYSVAVKEVGKEIIFLRKIVNGGADQSYGIEVAKLAGLPDSVILRAKGILKSLENTKDSKKSTETPFLEAAADISNKSIKPLQLSFTDLEKDTIVKELASLDILNLTPMEGFNKLFEFIKKAKSI